MAVVVAPAQDWPGQDWPGQDRTEQDRTGQDMPGHAGTWQYIVGRQHNRAIHLQISPSHKHFYVLAKKK